MSKVILLHKRPVGKPTVEDFEFIEETTPALIEGQLLLKTLYVSVDPYLRGRMKDVESYVAPFALNEPIQSFIIAEVVTSRHPDFTEGTFVTGHLPWKEEQISSGEGLTIIDENAADLSAYLGVLGMTGLTAYVGLTEIGKPKAGETLLVSGAAGAVGSVVGQVGKLLGLKVIGIAGTDEKIASLKAKFGFDEGINYKTEKDMAAAILKAAPEGVDIYFDNVGGDISDAALININRFGRIPLCGTIATYNDTDTNVGPRMQWRMVQRRILMQGFLLNDYPEKFEAGRAQLTAWVKEGKLTYSETIVEGFDNIPQAFIDLFDGKNEGKMVVKI
jgi:NADPH-dependent curcumin reductase CurA